MLEHIVPLMFVASLNLIGTTKHLIPVVILVDVEHLDAKALFQNPRQGIAG
jgi:hypothetical protein